MAQQATGPHAEPGESAGLLQNHDSSLAHRPAEEPAHSPLQRAAAAAAAAGAAAWESGITCILLAAFSYAWVSGGKEQSAQRMLRAFACRLGVMSRLAH